MSGLGDLHRMVSEGEHTADPGNCDRSEVRARFGASCGGQVLRQEAAQLDPIPGGFEVWA